jgi:homogentisate 1,2-dioxygenase
MGLIYGEYGGRSDEFQPGSISFECGSAYCLANIRTIDIKLADWKDIVVPHGVAYEEFKAATEDAAPAMQISPASIAFMVESSRPFTITDYAWSSDKKHEHEPKMWDNLVDNFSSHAKEVEALLHAKSQGVSSGDR